MTVPVLFVQGAGAGVHDQWDRKLADGLARCLGAAYEIHYPRMPDEDRPSYGAWRDTLLDEFDALGEGAIFVGHSVGGTILLHVLAERRAMPRPAAIVLIAPPFVGEGGWPAGDGMGSAMPMSEQLPGGVPVFLYQGTADRTVPYRHLQFHAAALPQARVRALANRDHQLNNDLSEVARDIRSVATVAHGGR